LLPVTVEASAREVFQHIYKTSSWEGGGSGRGSRPDATQVYRDVVSTLVQSADIRTVVDAGCGDWEMGRLIDWSSVAYLGLDVVPSVIEGNINEFSGPNVRFQCADLSNATLPRADLLLCKDVLQHWPLELVQRFLGQLRKRYRYMLLTNDLRSIHCADELLNGEIPLGSWRILDLEQPPFRVRPDWHFDYNIQDEYIKRVVLLVSARYRLRARLYSGSAINRVRRMPRANLAP
jgi:SAM-dependent methyltransferase